MLFVFKEGTIAVSPTRHEGLLDYCKCLWLGGLASFVFFEEGIPGVEKFLSGPTSSEETVFEDDDLYPFYKRITN